MQEFVNVWDLILQKDQDSDQSDNDASNDSEKKRNRKSRRRSRSRSKEVLRAERDKAATARKKDVALRPASYKSSLSLSLPVGSTRHKDKRTGSPERTHILVDNPAAYKQ